MDGNKRRNAFLAIHIIIAVVYSLLFALIPFPKPAGSWLMFVFSLIAIAGSCGCSLYAMGRNDSLMSKFYGYPVFKIGIGYMLLQLGLSIVVYSIGAFFNVPYWAGLLLSVVTAAAAGIGMIAADSAHALIEQADQQELATTQNITYFTVDIGECLDLCRDEALRPSLTELATKCKYSDPVSIPETKDIEQQIQMHLQELTGALRQNRQEKAGETVRLLLHLLSSRNRICQAHK